MKVGFIGAGKVACTFGHYLRQQGIDLVGYYSKTEESAVFAAEITQSSSLGLKELVSESTYIFITTPDDVIQNVWNQIKNFDLSGKNIFHMSGSISSEIFEDIDTCGAFGFTLHPLSPIADKSSFEKIASAIFTVEGRNLNRIQDFLRCLSIRVFPLKAEDKILYHAAAVIASNYPVALASISRDILEGCGLEREIAEEAVLLLMGNAIENLKLIGFNKALTGPIARGDANTVSKHVEKLEELSLLYKELGKATLKVAEAAGKVAGEKRDELLEILGGRSDEKDSSNL